MHYPFINIRKNPGFTIVELLIVIVVIAILAAISIVAYNGIQQRTRTTALQADLSSLSKKLKLYYAANDAYPNTNAQLKSLEWKASFDSYQKNSAGNLLYCVVASGANARFSVAARTSDNTAFTVSSDSGIQPYTGSFTGAWASDCPNYGFTVSPAEPGFAFSQGYHPTGWGSPGLKVWAGGTIDSI